MFIVRHAVRIAATLLIIALSHQVASAQEAAAGEVFAAITRQPSEGVSPADFSAENVSKVGVWWRDQIVSKMPASTGGSVTVNSTLVEIQGKRLGVSKLAAGAIPMAVLVFGIEGEEMVRVQCATKIRKPVPVFSGACGDKVREAFGVSVPR